MGLAIRLAVLLLLLGMKIAWRPAPSRGLAIQIPQTPTPCMDESASHRAHVLANGTVQIKGSTLAHAQLPATLQQLYANRAERVLFITAEPAATMQAVTTIIAIVPPSLSTATCRTVKPPWQKSL